MMRTPDHCLEASSPRRRPPALGHPDDDPAGILDFSEREIRHGKSSLDLRMGAEMAYLGMVVGLERAAHCRLPSESMRSDALARLGHIDRNLPAVYRRLQREVQRECFHYARCSQPGLFKAVGTARKFVRSLPPKLPR